MRNPFRRSRTRFESAPNRTGAATLANYYQRVAKVYNGRWIITPPPALQLTGLTATGEQIREWARLNHLDLSFGVDPDLRFAQLEASSAIEACLWLKRFNQDTGYRYEIETRDCDNFARRFRAFPDLFAQPEVAAQAAVFGIYAEMHHPFAGITDGIHALNAAWTNRGVYVFEPQNLSLTYQRLEDWPNRSGITSALLD